MRILVTGAAGFIGFSVIRKLLGRGDHVIGIDNVNDYYDPILKENRLAKLDGMQANFQFTKVDFADDITLEEALQHVEFDKIIHLGAQAGVRYSIENPRAYIRANIMGHINLLELARHRKSTHMVYASSSSVYGSNTISPFSVEHRVDNPISLYAATKKSDELMSETYAHLYRTPLTGLRFFTVYGPWGRPDMALWMFTENILNEKPIKVFNNGDMMRDFTYIDDIVAGVISCLDNPPKDNQSQKAGGSVSPHALYNIGNNKPEHLGTMIEIIEECCGKKAEKIMMPMQAGDVPASFADIDAISNDLGYKPSTSINVGIPNFVDWYKKYKGI